MSRYKALLVQETASGLRADVVERAMQALPQGELLICVSYSSLNYKDALSATGHRGVTREYPHVPGIDAAGRVVESSCARFPVGMSVIVTGYDLGANTDGGYAQYIRVPASWAVPLPDGLSLRESMILGTAGLTAALCVDKLLRAGVVEGGSVLVTGSTGGVGSLAVMLLSRLGYRVAGSTGKVGRSDFLQRLGATQVIDRDLLLEGAGKPLLKRKWAGAVDTVGGEMLFHVIRSLHYGASVTSCGLAGGAEFQATVLPFILRGINLLGVDSVELPLAEKAAMWQRLATDWKLDDMEQVCHEIALEDVPEAVDRILAGRVFGRILVRID